MYRTIKDFEDAWRHESTSTLKMLNALTDASLEQPVTDGHRTLGRIAWHVTVTVPEMADKMGIGIEEFDCNAPVPKTAKAIVDAYLLVSKKLSERVRLDWEDDTLETTVDMYGETWKRGFGLKALVDHQIHHRGQMTVLMRQAGIKVPPLYGPAKEEWSQYGMEPPAV
jgi:uncharacterized damage-inducible protein DinB